MKCLCVLGASAVKSLCPPLAQSLKFQIPNLKFSFALKSLTTVPHICLDKLVTHMIPSARHDGSIQPGKALLG